MIETIKKTNIYVLLTSFIIVFAFTAALINGPGFTDTIGALLAAASFLYGILITFSISNNQEKLSTINRLLKTDEANLLSIYQLSKKFGAAASNKTRELIDKHLIDQIDFKLIDFHKSHASFYDIYNHCLGIKPKGEGEAVIYEQMFNLLNETSGNRKQVETLIHDKVSSYEWGSLMALLLLFYVLIIDLNTGTWFSVLVSTVLAAVATLLLLILRDFSTLRWKAQDWIWEPLYNLFLSLDLLPYYSEWVLIYKEAQPPVGSRIRVAHYANPYPDMQDKTVKEYVVNEYLAEHLSSRHGR